MKFYAFGSDGSVLVTDDYAAEEIKKGIHIKNILSDFRLDRNAMSVRIYDENNNLVKKVFYPF